MAQDGEDEPLIGPKSNYGQVYGNYHDYSWGQREKRESDAELLLITPKSNYGRVYGNYHDYGMMRQKRQVDYNEVLLAPKSNYGQVYGNYHDYSYGRVKRNVYDFCVDGQRETRREYRNGNMYIFC